MAKRTDLRARLTVKGNYSVPLGGAAAALIPTKGILFPYTPNINVAHQVEYSTYELVHTNYQQNAYAKTRNPSIQLTGAFISQTPAEAAYAVGVLHFLRIVTKMNFGADDDDRGTPPPVLNFSAYGTYNFANVPVLVGSFNVSYEDGVDYVEVDINGEKQQIPSVFNLSMDLLPQYSPAKQNQFLLKDFASGRGYRDLL